MLSIWILTQEYNAYDQYGEYFVDCWLNKPTAQELLSNGVPANRLEYTLNGGGRLDKEFDNDWFYLVEKKL